MTICYVNSINNVETENAIKQLEVQAINFAFRFTKDASVRADYMRKVKDVSNELSSVYKSGQISAKSAAEAANQLRNEIMEFSRINSSDLGRAKASALKAKGLNLEQLLSKYSKQKYSKSFDMLNDVERSAVYVEVVSSAGRSNPKVNIRTKRMAGIGRGLWVLTALLAIYNVSNAENKVDAAGREVANIAGGFAGGAGGGAAAGIWFGPVGVAIGIIIGGVLGSLMSDQVYVELSGPDGIFPRSFIPRFTGFASVDEKGMANALFKEASYETNKVLNVFKQLNDKYSTDADDVALIYVQLIRNNPGTVQVAVRQNIDLRNYLIMLLDQGWTTKDEHNCISYLKKM